MNYVRSADGLRGVAALNVAVAHFVCAFYPSLMAMNFPSIFERPKSSSVLYKIATTPIVTLGFNGHFAVMLFFVLSGFVLARPYFSCDILSLKLRLVRRYVRLGFPIGIVICISYILLTLNLYVTSEAADISGSNGWLGRYFINDIGIIYFLKVAFYEGVILGNGILIPPLWTLKIEFFGSLYILLFYIATPKQYESILAIMVSLLLIISYGANAIYYLCFFAGAYLNYVSLKKITALGAALLGLYFGAFQYSSCFYSFLPELPLFEIKNWYNAIGAILLVAAVANGVAERFLGSAVLIFIGKISFSLYLLHMPVLCSVICYLYVFGMQGKILTLFLLVLYLGITILLSWFFYCYVDKRGISLSKKIFHKEQFKVGSECSNSI